MFRDIYKHYFSVLHFKIGPLLFKIEGVSGFVLQSCPEQKQKKFCSPPDYRLSTKKNFLFFIFFFVKIFLWQNTIYRTEKKNHISFLFNKNCLRCPYLAYTTILMVEWQGTTWGPWWILLNIQIYGRVKEDWRSWEFYYKTLGKYKMSNWAIIP